jgi:hypothetical protein
MQDSMSPQEKADTPTSINTKQATQGQPANSSTPQSIATGTSSDIPRYQEQTNGPGQDVHDNMHERNMRRLTGALVFVAVVQIAVYVMLWVQAKRQSDISESAVGVANQSLLFQRETDSISQVAQQRISDSSFALSKHVSTTQELFAKIETKAYVVFKEVAYLNFKVGDSVRATVVAMNVGKTPANQVIINTALKIGTGIYPHELENVDTGFGNPNPIPFTLGPSMSAGNMHSFRILTTRDSVDIYAGRRHLYFWGKADYLDIYGRKETTRFCYMYIPKDKTFLIVTKYNDMR